MIGTAAVPSCLLLSNFWSLKADSYVSWNVRIWNWEVSPGLGITGGPEALNLYAWGGGSHYVKCWPQWLLLFVRGASLLAQGENYLSSIKARDNRLERDSSGLPEVVQPEVL